MIHTDFDFSKDREVLHVVKGEWKCPECRVTARGVRDVHLPDCSFVNPVRSVVSDAADLFVDEKRSFEGGG